MTAAPETVHGQPGAPDRRPGAALADDRPVPVLRPPRRRLPGGRRGDGAGRPHRRPRPGAGLLGRRRLEHVPRAHRAGLPEPPAPWLRDRDLRAPGPDRPLRLARRRCPLRPRRRAVAHGGSRHRPRGDVPAARPRGPQPLGALPDLAQPARRRQARGAVLHDVLGRRHPGGAHGRRRRPGHRGHRHRRRVRRGGAADAAARLLRVACRRRRGHLAPAPGAGRPVRAAGGRRSRHRPRALRVRGRDPAGGRRRGRQRHGCRGAGRLGR